MDQHEGRIEALQRLYASSTDLVRGRGMSEPEALAHYAAYCDFVVQSTGRSTGRLLDLGCGNGWSSHAFAQRGFETVGVDLNPAAFEPPARPGLTLQQASVAGLPFADGSFDLVATYLMLEHVPDPESALREMIRVVRPGGSITIVCPNLLSVLASARGITSHAWKNRPLRTILFRSPEMPRHPAGNTLPECVAALFGSAARLAAKLVARRPTFSMREPDIRPPFYSDNDACYRCNPVDMVKFFRTRGCRVLRNGQYGRPPLSWLAATGVFVTARTPDASHTEPRGNVRGATVG